MADRFIPTAERAAAIASSNRLSSADRRSSSSSAASSSSPLQPPDAGEAGLPAAAAVVIGTRVGVPYDFRASVRPRGTRRAGLPLNGEDRAAAAARLDAEGSEECVRAACHSESISSRLLPGVGIGCSS